METDIGQPIDYDPTMRDDAPPEQQQRLEDTSTPIEDVQHVYQGGPPPPPPTHDEMMYQQQMMYPPPQMYAAESPQSHDFFASIDKITIVVLFAAFIVGFFLGSSRQPVILRYD